VHGPNVSDVQEGETLKFLDGGHEHWAIVLKVTSVQGGEDLYRIHAIDDDKEPFPNIMYDSRDALVRGGICKWLAWSVVMCDVTYSKREKEIAPVASRIFSLASSKQPLEPVHPPHSRLDAFFPSAKPFQRDRILATSSQTR
jgi:hypothetical protein